VASECEEMVLAVIEKRLTGKQASSTRPVAGSTGLAERRETLGWRRESAGKSGGSNRL